MTLPADSAIDRIADTLDGKEWSPDVIDAIAEIVRATGCTISEPYEIEDGELEAHLEAAARLTR